MKQFLLASATLLCLAACDSRIDDETIAENLAESPDAGGAVEAGPPSEANAAKAMADESANAVHKNMTE